MAAARSASSSSCSCEDDTAAADAACRVQMPKSPQKPSGLVEQGLTCFTIRSTSQRIIKLTSLSVYKLAPCEATGLET